jgi:Nif-specific regulatory protein
MVSGTTAYLVVRRDDGFGDVFQLDPAQNYGLGRAATNLIVLKDDLCSRDHAEVAFTGGRWRVRDLGSLNGTRVNDVRVEGERELSAGDQLHLGRTNMVFVEDLDQLPDLPPHEAPEETDGGMSIKKRLGQTRFLTPPPAVGAAEGQTSAGARHGLSRDLSLLYRLALDMGMAPGYEDLCRIVLDALLEATPAEVGAILTVPNRPPAPAGSRPRAGPEVGTGKSLRGVELEVTVHRHRDPAMPNYIRVSEYVSNEVLGSREAVLAEDVARDRYLRNRESLSDLGATSLICAPILFGEKVLGLIHLYCTDPMKALDAEDLEFTMAVAKQLGGVIHNLQKQQSLSAENRELRDQLKVESELVGQSAAIRDIERQVAMVANTNATCLIRGESGVGKELVARAVHFSSPRRDGPFVCLNCAALTETLLESELFGHEKGSFTGATEKKVGKFEAANHGTIFLDEIGEMTVGTQAKLLRILEGHPFERVGGSVPIRVDVRVVSATNQPLEEAVRSGDFRRDLFFRLQVVEIRVPPLRDRKSDIPLLAEHFLARFVRETGRKIRGFTQGAMKKMEDYHWPGNVRELRNVVERAVALGVGPMLDAGDVWLSSLEVKLTPRAAGEPGFTPVSLEEGEKRLILKTLEYTDWNKSQAAGILEIECSTLDRKIKMYGLNRGMDAPAPPDRATPLCNPHPADRTPRVERRSDALDSDEHGGGNGQGLHLPNEQETEKEVARVLLRSFIEALEAANWSIGAAGALLNKGRQFLPRKTEQLFDRFPDLQQEQEFTRLARWCSARLKKPPSGDSVS